MPARRPGHTRISTKNQVTIPVATLRAAGLKPGDELRVESDADGRLVLERSEDELEKFIGSMPGYWPPGWLDKLRDEWER